MEVPSGYYDRRTVGGYYVLPHSRYFISVDSFIVFGSV